MFLENLIIINYRSCKNVELKFLKDSPNVFIGINDCGKTTILKAIGLLLDEKTEYYYTKANSSKQDLSNSTLSEGELQEILSRYNLPPLEYGNNETFILGKLILEDGDLPQEIESELSNGLLWALESTTKDHFWIAKVFRREDSKPQSYLLTSDQLENIEMGNLWSRTSAALNGIVKELDISKADIENDNKKGRFSNLELMRSIYNRVGIEKCWTTFKIEKTDKSIFPIYRYLDWNSSFEDIKKTATDALTASIGLIMQPLRELANKASNDAENSINKTLERIQETISKVLPSITAVKTKVYIDVKESITDILVNKLNSDGDIHLDLQGDGVKRQIWFSLIKAGAESSIQAGLTNKKFIWAFDEPETHLYPTAQRQFFEIIKNVSRTNIQTLLSTHSTIFVDKAKLDSIKAVSLNDNMYSQIDECTAVDDIFDSLELRNSDFLFYDKFLGLEGETEFYLVPGLYKLYCGRSLAEDNIQLVNLTGSSKWTETKKALENVLSGFKKDLDLVVYLFDNDLSYEIGDDAVANNMYFAGIQDIEDSISDEVWISFVAESTQNEIQLSSADISEIRDQIPDDRKGNKKEKFYELLKKLVRDKLSASKGEQITWNILPEKGKESALLLLKHLQSLEQISPQIRNAFDKLQDK